MNQRIPIRQSKNTLPKNLFIKNDPFDILCKINNFDRDQQGTKTIEKRKQSHYHYPHKNMPVKWHVIKCMQALKGDAKFLWNKTGQNTRLCSHQFSSVNDDCMLQSTSSP